MVIPNLIRASLLRSWSPKVAEVWYSIVPGQPHRHWLSGKASRAHPSRGPESQLTKFLLAPPVKQFFLFPSFKGLVQRQVTNLLVLNEILAEGLGGQKLCELQALRTAPEPAALTRGAAEASDKSPGSL